MPVAARTLATSAEGAARRRYPPSSLARRPLPRVSGDRGRGYGWRGTRCIILRSGIMTMRNPPPAGRCALVRSFPASDGMGGTGGLGGTVPLGDWRGGVVAGLGSGLGMAGSGMVSFHREAGRRSALGDRWLSGRPERCDGQGAGAQSLAGAQQGRRPVPAATAQGRCYRPGPAASIRHRHGQPAGGFVSAMGINDHVDRADAHELLR
jgi:hypothetical protein